ncbi:aegerolysin family protein [Flavobacterium gelatinilyticum]|uniref:aegerolysin family protein n=1 Tax=Flavobacterium gelatinilyticum TaxID=3003260 RepID=UPI002481693E|nr:aegerolysin family protein [Flavobacterium gelatinilyticum]
MGYAQWIEIKIVSENMTVQVKNTKRDYGKFYEYGDKNKELSIAAINSIKIESGTSKRICACGRSGAATGTEGSFELYDGDTKIGKFYWDCPFWKSSNEISWTQSASETSYKTDKEGGNKSSGAIGNVTITCIKL